MYGIKKKLETILKTRKKKMGQDGFTLLELLVVVAILAAIAGTASIALQDTDARAAAAAHVAMMDEMNKGIRTFYVLNKNEYPGGFDSLIQVADVALATPALYENLTDNTFLTLAALPVAMYGEWLDTGFESLNYVALDQMPEDADSTITPRQDCTATNIDNLINSKANMVVAGNIFMSANANGCGVRATLVSDIAGGTADAPGYQVTSQIVGADPVGATAVNNVLPIALWNGGSERITGQPASDIATFDAAGNVVYLAVGIGPGSTLFEANAYGGMTTVPTYRHVKGAEYNRFIAIWDIGLYGAGTSTDLTDMSVSDHMRLVTVVDSAGDTKEEELGEWDGTRAT